MNSVALTHEELGIDLFGRRLWLGVLEYESPQLPKRSGECGALRLRGSRYPRLAEYVR